MKIEIVISSSYKKKANKFLRKHPQLISQYKKTLKILSHNPHHPSLRIHKLKGSLKHIHSVSINRKFRILLTFILHKNKVILLSIGSHDELY